MLLRQIIFFLLSAFVGGMCVLWFQMMQRESTRRKMESSTPSVVWRQNHLILSSENLYNELLAQGVAFPEIVLAQAVLETGHFKSNECTDKNNLFGLRLKDGTYMYFNHWTDCVATYKQCIQDWEYPPKNYFSYLDSLGYAEDSDYISKLKQIMK